MNAGRVAGELQVLAGCFAAGLAAGALYDVFRLIRLPFPKSRLRDAVFDLAYYAAVGALFALALYALNGGSPRLYALAGFALTGVQSVSRTAVGQIAPEEKAAEFYGLFSLASQLSNFIGPTLFGLLIVWFTNFYAGKGMEVLPAEQSGLMLAIASILVFLVAGMALLFTVRVWHRVDEEA